MRKKILIITGPTASGKSSLVSDLTGFLPIFDVVNGDSKQVYRELPILTAQPTIREGMLLYGYVSAVEDSYSVSRWLSDLKTVLEGSWVKGRTPIIVGGTALYLHCLANGMSFLPKLDPNILANLKEKLASLGKEGFIEYVGATRHHWKYRDHYRLIRDAAYIVQTGKTIDELYSQSEKLKLEFDEIDVTAFAPERKQIYKSIDKRLLQMIDEGAIEEVRDLMQYESIYKKCEVMTVHGLREIIDYINKKISFNEMVEATQKNIRNYAKRQLTWFRNKFPSIKFFSCRDQVLDYITQNYQQ